MSERSKRRTNYEKLSPADQLAIDTMLSNARKEEIDVVYKEAQAKDAFDRRPPSGWIILTFMLLFGLFVLLVFLPTIVADYYQHIIKSTGVYVCQSMNESYRDVDFTSFSYITVTCSHNIRVTLP